MGYTAEEIADVLDRAHDVMLVRGWAQGGYQNASGGVCAYGAMHYATTGDRMWSNELSDRAAVALCKFLGGCLVTFNDAEGRTIDDVLDAFRQTSKKLRNGELVP